MSFSSYGSSFEPQGRTFSQGRSLSRRSSVAFSGGAASAYAFSEPSMPGYVEDYPQPAYSIYAPPTARSLSRRMSGAPSISMSRQNSHYGDDHRMSGAGYPNSAMSQHRGAGVHRTQRRHSAVSFQHRPPSMHGNNYRKSTGSQIKFRRKGSNTAGISLGEAQSRIRLSSNDSYNAHDFHADRKGRILLKIRWAGYPSLTYELPAEGYDGRVSLTTVARRVARACVHFLQANIIPVPWDQVELHHLEEIATGVWQPMLSVR